LLAEAVEEAKVEEALVVIEQHFQAPIVTLVIFQYQHKHILLQ
jgi:hypothetical protein|tara:strand:+ start:151 stop:279 length:129 start_codon:yes stop_codon:yes gene_type:complete